MDSGSSCGTTMPQAIASCSIACGKAVATTGLPAAIASTRTPELICSRESYGNSTTSALRIRERRDGVSR